VFVVPAVHFHHSLSPRLLFPILGHSPLFVVPIPHHSSFSFPAVHHSLPFFVPRRRRFPQFIICRLSAWFPLFVVPCYSS
jgi:hypothetical protein